MKFSKSNETISPKNKKSNETKKYKQGARDIYLELGFDASENYCITLPSALLLAKQMDIPKPKFLFWRY